MLGRNECHISKECRAPTECRAHTECQRNRAQQSRQHSVCKEAPRKGNCCARETLRGGLAQVGQTLSVSQHLAVAEARAECLVPHCLHCLNRRASMPRCAYTHKPNEAGDLHSYTFLLSVCMCSRMPMHVGVHDVLLYAFAEHTRSLNTLDCLLFFLISLHTFCTVAVR